MVLNLILGILGGQELLVILLGLGVTWLFLVSAIYVGIRLALKNKKPNENAKQ